MAVCSRPSARLGLSARHCVFFKFNCSMYVDVLLVTLAVHGGSRMGSRPAVHQRYSSPSSCRQRESHSHSLTGARLLRLQRTSLWKANGIIAILYVHVRVLPACLLNRTRCSCWRHRLTESLAGPRHDLGGSSRSGSRRGLLLSCMEARGCRSISNHASQMRKHRCAEAYRLPENALDGRGGCS